MNSSQSTHSARASFHMISESGHCCRGNSARISRSQAGARTSLDECKSMCLNEPSCHFFSHAAHARSDYPSCAVCSACDLTYDSVSKRFSSWLRGEQTLTLIPTVSSGKQLLSPMLQGSYSKQLYGEEGRVPLEALRVVWLSLLNRTARDALAHIGLCKANARPPRHPFFWGIDTIANPIDAMWLNKRSPHVAIPDFGWAEVTHCANKNSLKRPAWQFGPMWLYVADGSGVSVNVGRSLVFTSFKLARNFLIQLFPGSRYGSCQGRLHTRNVSIGNSREHSYINGSKVLGISRRPARESITEGIVWVHLSLGSWERTPINVSALDSVQILNHKEYFSGETRHEIVLLRHAECDDLVPQRLRSLAGGVQDVMCGRFPNLMDCPLMDTLDASQSRSRTSVARRLGAGKWASQRSRRSRRSRGSYPDSDIWLKTSAGHQVHRESGEFDAHGSRSVVA